MFGRHPQAFSYWCLLRYLLRGVGLNSEIWPQEGLLGVRRSEWV